jgi:hypothetical protein
MPFPCFLNKLANPSATADAANLVSAGLTFEVDVDCGQGYALVDNICTGELRTSTHIVHAKQGRHTYPETRQMGRAEHNLVSVLARKARRHCCPQCIQFWSVWQSSDAFPSLATPPHTDLPPTCMPPSDAIPPTLRLTGASPVYGTAAGGAGKGKLEPGFPQMEAESGATTRCTAPLDGPDKPPVTVTAAGTAFPVGTTVVTCTAEDAAKNKSPPVPFAVVITCASGYNFKSDTGICEGEAWAALLMGSAGVALASGAEADLQKPGQPELGPLFAIGAQAWSRASHSSGRSLHQINPQRL